MLASVGCSIPIEETSLSSFVRIVETGADLDLSFASLMKPQTDHRTRQWLLGMVYEDYSPSLPVYGVAWEALARIPDLNHNPARVVS
jgi:hypothetical protein